MKQWYFKCPFPKNASPQFWIFSLTWQLFTFVFPNVYLVKLYKTQLTNKVSKSQFLKSLTVRAAHCGVLAWTSLHRLWPPPPSGCFLRHLRLRWSRHGRTWAVTRKATGWVDESVRTTLTRQRGHPHLPRLVLPRSLKKADFPLLLPKLP